MKIIPGLAGQSPYEAPMDDPCEERRDVGEQILQAVSPQRTAEPSLDVFLTGPVNMDMIFTELPGSPRPGTEVWAGGLGSAPGGIANMAVAMSRLGLSVGLASAFGDDSFGSYLWRTLAEQEQVDLGWSEVVHGWPTPVTVSLAYDADRGMVSYEENLPFPTDKLVATAPAARSYFVTLSERLPEWLSERRTTGGQVFADLGWDGSGTWSPGLLDALRSVDVFLPNAVEAMAYTRTDSPREALAALSDRVPVVVVKCGRRGAIARDARTGESVHEPAIEVPARDPTGAGDVFAGAFVFAQQTDWTLAQKLRFANLCAGLSVRHFSGSLGAPCWHEIGEWFAGVGVSTEYEYLGERLPEVAVADRARARPTLGYNTAS
jgi:sugar/nucleoside kinase (ribokinase family)